MLKTLTISNSQNQKITGILHNNNQSKTLFIIVPGYKTYKNDPAIKEMAVQLSKKYTVFRYDSTDDINVVRQENNLNSIVDFFRLKFDSLISCYVMAYGHRRAKLFKNMFGLRLTVATRDTSAYGQETI